MILFLKKMPRVKFLKSFLFLMVFSSFLAAVYWVFFTCSYYFVIPVEIDTKWNLPLIDIEIANRKYKVELDLGYKLSTLYQMDLNGIDKKFCETSSIFDVHGNIYENSVYQISGMKIHDFFLSQIKIEEESPEFLKNSVLQGEKDKLPYTGRIGREVFKGKNFLLDFPHSKIILCKNFKDLDEDCYKEEDFIQTPFLIDEKIGICFQVETDDGTKIFLLDSGASVSFIQLPVSEEILSADMGPGIPVWRSKKFILGNHDFGEKKLYLFKLSPLFGEINGFLGMDFLKEHAIYLDMEQSVAYIGKSSNTNS